jgi:hypothetical protein
MWPVALLFFAVRVSATVGANYVGARIANESPAVRKFGWSGLVSQAGVTIGLSAIIERLFPAFGTPFRAIAIACVALNEMIGPILFKATLDSQGESTTAGERERAAGAEEVEGA